MKLLTIKVQDRVAEIILTDAKEKGISAEELCRYIIGLYAQTALSKTGEALRLILDEAEAGFKELGDMVSKGYTDAAKKALKARARDGSLTCKNCTMRLKEQDIVEGKCSSCNAPISIELGGEHP